MQVGFSSSLGITAEFGEGVLFRPGSPRANHSVCQSAQLPQIFLGRHGNRKSHQKVTLTCWKGLSQEGTWTLA